MLVSPPQPTIRAAVRITEVSGIVSQMILLDLHRGFWRFEIHDLVRLGHNTLGNCDNEKKWLSRGRCTEQLAFRADRVLASRKKIGA